MKRMFYRLAALGAMGTTAYFVSVALSEQFSRTGTYPLLTQCLHSLHSHPLILKRMTPPLHPSGHPPTVSSNGFRVHRRSHPVQEAYVDQMGREVSNMRFFWEDSNGKYAIVNCQAIDGIITQLTVQFPNEHHIDIIKPKPTTTSYTPILSRFFSSKC